MEVKWKGGEERVTHAITHRWEEIRRKEFSPPFDQTIVLPGAVRASHRKMTWPRAGTFFFVWYFPLSLRLSLSFQSRERPMQQSVWYEGNWFTPSLQCKNIILSWIASPRMLSLHLYGTNYTLLEASIVLLRPFYFPLRLETKTLVWWKFRSKKKKIPLSKQRVIIELEECRCIYSLSKSTNEASTCMFDARCLALWKDTLTGRQITGGK